MDYDKLNKRIQYMLENESDNYLVNINLKKDISSKLLCYQHLHVFNLMTAIKSYNVILDGSDTGTGKTYTALAMCKQLDLRPFIICPKTIISVWKQVAKYYNIKPLGIVNYELIKNGKYYDESDKQVECPFLDMDDTLNKNNPYFWHLPANAIVIFDEVHKCKNAKTYNAKLLMSTKENINQKFKTIKVLMISATLSDTPKFFNVFGYMLGFYNNLKHANNWVKGMLREDQNYFGAKPKLSAINRNIYPDKGSRMCISELGDQFPKNQISADCYDIDKENQDEVNKSFNIMKLKMNELKKSDIVNNNNFVLTEIQKARMKIELLKVPVFEELIEEYIENGYNVVVFVNFIKTVEILSKKFNTKCLVTGSLSNKNDINKNIEDFQENRTNLIICTIQCASTGISLHDKYGKPRVSLISPSFSANDLIQVLGRIVRAGTKTPAIQRLIYTAGTCEEAICENVKNKLEFISKLNDNDLVDIKGL
jgi:superfamily II DNA or RNA helicase